MPSKLHGHIAKVHDSERHIGWLLVRKGTLTEGSLQRGYLQLLFHDADRGETFDDFQDDPEICDQMEKQLTEGVLDWYGNRYSAEWLDKEEAMKVRRAVGWTKDSFF